MHLARRGSCFCAVRGARTKAVRDIGLGGVAKHRIGGRKVQESVALYALWEAYVCFDGRFLEVCYTVMVLTPQAAVCVAACNAVGSKKKVAFAVSNIVKLGLLRAVGYGQVHTADCDISPVELVMQAHHRLIWPVRAGVTIAFRVSR